MPPPPSRSEKAAVRAAAPQLTIGCAGFPVPATRYFKEFLFVEVQETHIALPGTGTIRRWRREAPAGFTFSMLAPREIGQEGFRAGKAVDNALKALVEVGKELSADTAVFAAPPDFTNNRANKAVVKEFLLGLKKKFAHLVWEAPPTWDADDAAMPSCSFVADWSDVWMPDPDPAWLWPAS